MSARIRVLHLDDDPDATRLLSIFLSHEQDMEDVCALNDPSLLLDEVARVRPDVAVVDLSMPGQDSVELIGRLKRAHPGLRVVVFSGYAEPGTLERVRSAGADRIVQKGFDFDQLLAAIRAPAAEDGHQAG